MVGKLKREGMKTVNIPAELHSRIKVRAAKTGTNMLVLITDYLERGLKRQRV